VYVVGFQEIFCTSELFTLRFTTVVFFFPEIMVQLSTLDGISQLVLPVLQEDSRPSSQFTLNQGNT